ncbi:hypothetical protein K7J14_08410 [Treponema zuelzerae]|uniref:Uncharacterized protein n=1 Tax=Teretinema zuelzerae TaxID=156 RepID=A0AAE3EHV7_9SPIR|nr:hypothetical protein [Teretinema zuelzerae]MCD1654727.1 hypothetical protein [Teretinema zuelzerae]
MNATDEYLKALTILMRHDLQDADLSQEWFIVCIDNAKRFSRSIQRKLPNIRDHDDVANDATTSLWENCFIKGQIVRKSITTMLFYRVKHFALYRRKKDFDISYESIIDELGEGNSYGNLQNMQEVNRIGNLLPRASSGRRERNKTPVSTPGKKLQRKEGSVLPKRSLAPPVKEYTQLTLDL